MNTPDPKDAANKDAQEPKGIAKFFRWLNGEDMSEDNHRPMGRVLMTILVLYLMAASLISAYCLWGLMDAVPSNESASSIKSDSASATTDADNGQKIQGDGQGNNAGNGQDERDAKVCHSGALQSSWPEKCSSAKLTLAVPLSSASGETQYITPLMV